MPRRARKKSGSGLYHVVMRGINRQSIFEDDEDYRMFCLTLKGCKAKSGFSLYGYCLMSNHVHLLIREGGEELGLIFRRIGASYVFWYNRKYERCGHLFQDRFKSETVENDVYLLTALRYIHQNPLKANMVAAIAEYPWSSYREYTGTEDICDTGFVLSLFSDDHKKAVELFKDFNAQLSDVKCLEYDDRVRLSDPEAREVVLKLVEVGNTKEIQAFSRIERNRVVRLLKANSLSIRQIERLTGISYGVIRKC